ncbi:hypothetical protein F5Y18DRAFT_116589 [Xylariaceae sp. FL1019]|nr:hypothetical protein F5Y18DRAFT_116589 [Xylariaceae sp. FL1019]
MEPISITSAAIAIGGLAFKLLTVLVSWRDAPEDVRRLLQEVRTLITSTKFVETALNRVQGDPHVRKHIDSALWAHINAIMLDLQHTLEEYLSLLGGADQTISSLKAGWYMLFRKKKVVAFQARIVNFNAALQMILLIVNIASQTASVQAIETNNREMRTLKEMGATNNREMRALKEMVAAFSTRVSSPNVSALPATEEDKRVNNNLEVFVKAAADFQASHSAPGLAEYCSWSAAASPMPAAHERCTEHMCRDIGSQYESIEPEAPPAAVASTAAVGIRGIEATVNNPPYTTINDAVHHGHTKRGNEALQECNFVEAEIRFQKALSSCTASSLHGWPHLLLQMKLAFCELFQGKLQMAQNRIVSLIESVPTDHLIGNQLCYLLALSQAHALDFADAEQTCGTLFERLSDEPPEGAITKEDVVLVYCTSLRGSGKDEDRRAMTASYPDVDEGKPVPRPFDALARCRELLSYVLGLDVNSDQVALREYIDNMHCLPMATKPTALQECPPELRRSQQLARVREHPASQSCSTLPSHHRSNSLGRIVVTLKELVRPMSAHRDGEHRGPQFRDWFRKAHGHRTGLGEVQQYPSPVSISSPVPHHESDSIPAFELDDTPGPPGMCAMEAPLSPSPSPSPSASATTFGCPAAEYNESSLQSYVQSDTAHRITTRMDDDAISRPNSKCKFPLGHSASRDAEAGPSEMSESPRARSRRSSLNISQPEHGVGRYRHQNSPSARLRKRRGKSSKPEPAGQSIIDNDLTSEQALRDRYNHDALPLRPGSSSAASGHRCATPY